MLPLLVHGESATGSYSRHPQSCLQKQLILLKSALLFFDVVLAGLAIFLLTPPLCIPPYS